MFVKEPPETGDGVDVTWTDHENGRPVLRHVWHVQRVPADLTRAFLLHAVGLAEVCARVTCVVLQGGSLWVDTKSRFAALVGSHTIVGRGDAEDERSSDPSSNESPSLLQVHSALNRKGSEKGGSFAQAAAVKLPPPGNGKKDAF